MKWHIGQDIVAIRDATPIKDGDVFTIKGLRSAPCKCKNIDIDIGFNEVANFETCAWCDCKTKSKDDVIWFSEKNFAPLDSLVNISELTEVLNEPIFK